MEQAALHHGIACSRGATVAAGTIIQYAPREADCGVRNLISPPPPLIAPVVMRTFGFALLHLKAAMSRPGGDIKLPQFRTGPVPSDTVGFQVRESRSKPAVADEVDEHQLTAVNFPGAMAAPTSLGPPCRMAALRAFTVQSAPS